MDQWDPSDIFGAGWYKTHCAFFVSDFQSYILYTTYLLALCQSLQTATAVSTACMKNSFNGTYITGACDYGASDSGYMYMCSLDNNVCALSGDCSQSMIGRVPIAHTCSPALDYLYCGDDTATCLFSETLSNFDYVLIVNQFTGSSYSISSSFSKTNSNRNSHSFSESTTESASESSESSTYSSSSVEAGISSALSIANSSCLHGSLPLL